MLMAGAGLTCEYVFVHSWLSECTPCLMARKVQTHAYTARCSTCSHSVRQVRAVVINVRNSSAAPAHRLSFHCENCVVYGQIIADSSPLIT